MKKEKIFRNLIILLLMAAFFFSVSVSADENERRGIRRYGKRLEKMDTRVGFINPRLKMEEEKREFELKKKFRPKGEENIKETFRFKSFDRNRRLKNLEERRVINIDKLRRVKKPYFKNKISTFPGELMYKEVERIKELREKSREEFKKRLEKRKETIREKLEELRRERIERLKEFKEKVKEIKDEKKRKIVERVNDRIEKLNERRTKFLENLSNRLEKLVEKIEAVINVLEEKGANVTAAKTKLNILKDRITAFNAKVEEQKEKAYVVQITDEATLGKSVSSVYKRLIADLRTLKTEFISIRKDLKEVIFEVRKASQSIKPTLSPSPVASPTAGL